jgi:hypothetical protein
MLTWKDKRDYVRGGGVRCPYCQSKDLEAGEAEFDADFAWRTITCTGCGEAWHEVFHLATIHALDVEGCPVLDDEDEL